jgi:K319L-like, PKD domain
MRKRMLAPALWVTTALILASCGGGGGSGSSNPPANNAPTANAGPNQTVNAGAAVSLNGSGTDADGSVAGYTWTQTGGTPTVTLSSNTVAQPTFAAPSVAAGTTLTFSLVVRDNRGASSTASSVIITVNPVAAGAVTGRISFMRVPFSAQLNVGLNYSSPQNQPARGVVVRALDAGTQAVLATGTTDANGDYSLTVASNTDINIQVVAQMQRTGALPNWNFTVADLDVNTTPYAYTNSASFNSDAGAGHNILIPSGFNASGGVTGTRASAPFAILDTIYQSYQLVLSAAPNANFPALIVDWAANNTPEEGTFFTGAAPQHIALTADVTADTDEFDQHVIAHEFGHYIEHNFSRADNIGGAHAIGDKLDIRVAFGEGFGYAFGAIVLNDPVTRDSFVDDACPGDQCSSTFNVETNPPTSPPGVNGDYGCWCSESSVWSILWDLYDNSVDANDAVALGFQPMWNVLINSQRTTPAFTSIFSFITALKTASPADAAAIDALVTAQNTNTITDIWGTGETHVPTPVASAAALPLYTNYGAIGGSAKVLLNVNDAGTHNALGNHRYIRFDVASTRSITVTASSSNPNQPDTDFKVWRAGTFVRAGEDPPSENPETETFTATAGTYLIDAYDCANGCRSPQGVEGDYNITVTVN